MFVELNKKKYRVQTDEFDTVTPIEFNTLKIYPKLSQLERYVSLINELRFNHKSNLIILNPTHGGFLPIECSPQFERVFLINADDANNKSVVNIDENIVSHNVNNITWSNVNVQINILNNTICFAETLINPNIEFLINIKPILICPENNEILISNLYTPAIQLSNSNLFVYIPNMYSRDFNDNFHYFLENNVLKYDNLIHLCIMVKNAGDEFEHMLTKNLPYIDRWTILDTGSTDNTIDIINRVLVGKKKGELFCEPFINFKESRNRCLDLAGKACKFTIMLDDTYIIENNLREFLYSVRGDQYADSYSMFIKTNDSMYTSNRILKTDRNMRYIYKIHEIVNDANNVNVSIPLNKSSIFDCTSNYMVDRTMNRKTYELELLMEEIHDNPDISRHYYYVAQTYSVIKKYELAYEFYLKRAYHPNDGYIQEKIDAFFEAARTAQFQLHKPWECCEKLYLSAHELDKSRPESLYYIGHYYYGNNIELAYMYFKMAFDIGFPIHCQHSLKPTLSYYYVPKFLTELCYSFKNYILGERVSQYFLQHNNSSVEYYDVIKSWHDIFVVLNNAVPNSQISAYLPKPLLCFVADGGFDYWTGSDILIKGVGGSETYIIETARYIQQHGFFNVVVFCNCESSEIFEGVIYYSLKKYFSFISENIIHTCIISRYSEYLPVSLNSLIENIHMVIHDLTPSGLVIPIHPKLKNVFCLTEWHVEHMASIFPQLKDRLVPFYYGIDFRNFGSANNYSNVKIPYKFIYSSFPNRGLLQLLLMWPKIINIQPLACLHIYSDVNGKWVNSVAGEQMTVIRDLLNTHKHLNIYYHGWVNKKELADAWITTDVWLYPCTFKETFCLTALEAAITKTFVVCPNLAALNNTVGNRGLLVEGDATTETWQNLTIDLLFNYLNNVNTKLELVNKNYEWAMTLSWKAQSEKLLERYIFN